jgi:hypothetical protein
MRAQNLLLSVSIHLAALAVGWLAVGRALIETRPRNSLLLTTIAVSAVRTSRSGHGARSTRQHRTASLSASKKLSLADLAPARRSEATPFAKGPAALASEELNPEGQAALHERIDGGLEYPAALVDTGREGTVSLRFEVDRAGVLHGGFSEIEAEDRILKVLVLQNLRKTLDHALPIRAHTDRRAIEVAATFNFAVVLRKEIAPPSPPAIVKDTLSFERTTLSPRVSENALAGGSYGGQAAMNDHSQSPAVYRKWKLDKNSVAALESNTGTQGVGVGVDPVRLFKWIFGSGKSAFDPLERYKSDPDY